MGDEQAARIEDVILPVLGDHGLELVELEWRPRRPRSVLRVFVDKPGGVGIGDCERVSREIGHLLDAEPVIEDPYDLEVSSPGLDRLLRSDRELRWAVGKRVRCWLAGGEELWGRLADVGPDRLVLERESDRIEVERPSVTKARLDVDVPWPRVKPRE
jgi:ribosome maturation factor RimP